MSDREILEKARMKVTEQRAVTRTLLIDIVGPHRVDEVLTQDRYLPLLRRILRSKGQDKEAAQLLKAAASQQ